MKRGSLYSDSKVLVAFHGTLLRPHQNGFHVFGQAWSLPGVEPVQFLLHRIADKNYLRTMPLWRC